MTEWRWVATDVALAIHDRQIAEHGGLSGIRDIGLLHSALARPQNLAAYGDPDAAGLAASHVFGLSRNYALVDGNKRTAWVVASVFLAGNEVDFRFEPVDAVALVEAVASGRLPEIDLAAWFRDRLSLAR